MDSFIYGTGQFFCDIINSVGLLKLWKNIGCAYNWGPDGEFVIRHTSADNTYAIGLIALIAIVVVLFIMGRSVD
jgi:hypothetical protein